MRQQSFGAQALRPGITAFFVVLLSAGFASSTAAQTQGSEAVEENYIKSEHRIPMRDGITLFTAIYRPRDDSQDYPIMLCRTPYSCRPYGEDAYRSRIGPSPTMMEEKYIFVYQDVRGRWMSEGQYDNMRPHVPGAEPIDESSDTYDTIEWLLENVEGHNGKVGMWGISYPGFYAAAALPESHPALVAVSPQAPIADFYFDDFHHRGAYTLAYFLITPVFGYQKDGPTKSGWYPITRPPTQDGYKFYLDLGPLSNAKKYYKDDNFFWEQITEHPNYDEFWQKRSILPHLENLTANTLVVGGWFDAEDLYGPLQIYKSIERENPDTQNSLVMGPWSHGDWSRQRETQTVGPIAFGDDISKYYQENVEAVFFRHHLKGDDTEEDDLGLPEALVFDTGAKGWTGFDAWPPQSAEPTAFYLRGDETLSRRPPQSDDPPLSEFVSDPDHPVPYTDQTRIVFTPRAYMAEDQRFASRRPDVLSFRSPVLTQDVTVAGELEATLYVSTSRTAADWVVKLIDVYPSDHPQYDHTPETIDLGDYEQLVRGEIVRGRFRNGFDDTPEPFVPDQVVEIKLPLQDVYHTFKAGHQILVHVQSTWFPLFDRNPQTYVPNIFEAEAEDFVKAVHRVYHTPGLSSRLDMDLLPKGMMVELSAPDGTEIDE